MSQTSDGHSFLVYGPLGKASLEISNRNITGGIYKLACLHQLSQLPRKYSVGIQGPGVLKSIKLETEDTSVL